MGFSPLGLVVAVAVLVPNLLLLRFPPRDGFPRARVPVLLRWVERVGQALCLVVPAITTAGQVRWWWAVPVFGALAGYYLLWARYLTRRRDTTALYGPVWGIPVLMAILPVLVFAATGLWLSNPWILGSAAVLAAGHIPASSIIARSILSQR